MVNHNPKLLPDSSGFSGVPMVHSLSDHVHDRDDLLVPSSEMEKLLAAGRDLHVYDLLHTRPDRFVYRARRDGMLSNRTQTLS